MRRAEPDLGLRLGLKVLYAWRKGPRSAEIDGGRFSVDFFVDNRGRNGVVTKKESGLWRFLVWVGWVG